MTPEKIAMVQASFEQVLPIADTAAALFYTRLFELDPSLRILFHGDMQEQGRKLMAMLQMAVANLGRLETAVPTAQALGRSHVTYGITDSHYDTVGAALIWTLEKVLGEGFTPGVRQAWVEAYTVLASTMKAASQVPALNPVVM